MVNILSDNPEMFVNVLLTLYRASAAECEDNNLPVRCRLRLQKIIKHSKMHVLLHTVVNFGQISTRSQFMKPSYRGCFWSEDE